MGNPAEMIRTAAAISGDKSAQAERAAEIARILALQERQEVAFQDGDTETLAIIGNELDERVTPDLDGHIA